MQYPFNYLAFGLPIISSIELPALNVSSSQDLQSPVKVSVGATPITLRRPPLEDEQECVYNDTEFIYQIEGIARYYVTDGNRITIEPFCSNWDEILLYVYSNCLAAILFQRNIVPFHVSGVFIDPNRVLLFAAPSGTGKSTTALKLQELGYAPFTDDTAVLSIENNICYAQASYPMIRIWQNTFEQQSLFVDAQKKQLYAEFDKFGFHFHERFDGKKVEVAAIVFLDKNGDEMSVNTASDMESFMGLGANVYRAHWLIGMKKGQLLFKKLKEINQVLPAFTAQRPGTKNSIESFPSFIEKHLIQPLTQRRHSA
jgi:hypothetical protein